MVISRRVQEELSQPSLPPEPSNTPSPSSSLDKMHGSFGFFRNKPSYKTWTAEEHDRFLEALELYPSGPWKHIAEHVGTKTARQTMTHAQKYREKMARKRRNLGDRYFKAVATPRPMKIPRSTMPTKSTPFVMTPRRVTNAHQNATLSADEINLDVLAKTLQKPRPVPFVSWGGHFSDISINTSNDSSSSRFGCDECVDDDDQDIHDLDVDALITGLFANQATSTASVVVRRSTSTQSFASLPTQSSANH